MNVYLLFGSCLILCVAAVIMRELKSSLLPIVSSVFCVVLCVQAVFTIMPVINYLKSLGNNWAVLSSYVPYVMKALGISFVGTLASDLCKESGMNSAVFGVDLIVKGMLLSLALPLMIQVCETVTQMIES